jgi:uncharacterized protein with HEPN domain
MRDDSEKLLDINDSIERINKYAARGKETFQKEELIQTWIIHNLLIIGEAASRISDEFKASNSEIPWSKIIGMRNILVHGYFQIDIDIVWAVIEKDLPQLREMIKNVL